MASVSASIFTAAFNQAWQAAATESSEMPSLAMFDSRVFVIPNRTDVENYFIWRQARERAARIKELERLREIWSDPQAAAAKRKGMFYDAASVPPSIRDVRLVGEGVKKPILKPDNYDSLMEELERLKAYVEPEPLSF